MADFVKLVCGFAHATAAVQLATLHATARLAEAWLEVAGHWLAQPPYRVVGQAEILSLPMLPRWIDGEQNP